MSNTQINLNRTRLKEFKHINIYINVYIPDLKKSNKLFKRSDLNKRNRFFLNHDFCNPVYIVVPGTCTDDHDLETVWLYIHASSALSLHMGV